MMDFIGDKSKISKAILIHSLGKIGLPDYIGSIDDCINEIYNRFKELGLPIEYTCYNCEAATINMNFCPFCGVRLDGPAFSFVLQKKKGLKTHSVSRKRGRGKLRKEEERVSGAALFDAMIEDIDLGKLGARIKYRNTVNSFWHDYCKCFAKAFIGRYSMRIHLPFKADAFSMPKVPIDMGVPQHNFMSRLFVVAYDEVDIARALVLEAFVLKTEQRHRVLARRTAQKGNKNAYLHNSDDDCDATQTSNRKQTEGVQEKNLFR